MVRKLRQIGVGLPQIEAQDEYQPWVTQAEAQPGQDRPDESIVPRSSMMKGILEQEQLSEEKRYTEHMEKQREDQDTDSLLQVAGQIGQIAAFAMGGPIGGTVAGLANVGLGAYTSSTGPGEFTRETSSSQQALEKSGATQTPGSRIASRAIKSGIASEREQQGQLAGKSGFAEAMGLASQGLSIMNAVGGTAELLPGQPAGAYQNLTAPALMEEGDLFEMAQGWAQSANADMLPPGTTPQDAVNQMQELYGLQMARGEAPSSTFSRYPGQFAEGIPGLRRILGSPLGSEISPGSLQGRIQELTSLPRGAGGTSAYAVAPESTGSFNLAGGVPATHMGLRPDPPRPRATPAALPLGGGATSRPAPAQMNEMEREYLLNEMQRRFNPFGYDTAPRRSGGF